MIELAPHAEGAILPVRAAPGARRDEIRGEQDGALKVCVTQSAERGKANKALIALLAKRLRLRKSQFELIAGATARTKRLLVRDVTPDELTAILRERLAL